MILVALQDIVQAYKEYYMQALLFGMAGCVIYIIINIIRSLYLIFIKREKFQLRRSFFHLIWFSVFSFYFSYVIYITLSGREAGSRDGINLRLFSTLIKDGELNVFGVENILLFIPFGILVPYLWKFFRKWYRTLLMGFICSGTIEIIQLFSERGYFELDDMMLNTVGAGIGYVIYWSVSSFVVSLLLLRRERSRRA